MAKIISGKDLSAQLKDEMKAQVATFPEKYGRVPHLVVILVGEDPGSVSYVTGKAKASEYVGIKNTTIRKPDTISEAELLGMIEELNADDSVDGILVQLPLPKHISEDKVIATIAKEKDVDGFHPLNVAALWQKQDCVLPCTPKGIIKMMKKAGVEIVGKRAVVIGRSNIVGKPMASLMMQKAYPGDATVTVCHSRSKDLVKECQEADIIIDVRFLPNPFYIKEIRAYTGLEAPIRDYVYGCRFCQRLERTGHTLVTRPPLVQVGPDHMVEACPLCADI